MAKSTPYLGIYFHDEFDIYSAKVEKQRFTLIDTHMAFLADVVGNGRIEGWDLSINSQLLLTVSPGWGFLDRFSIKTYGKINKSAGINKFYYIWMRRRPGVVGDLSGFSNMTLVQFSDTTPPAVPTNFTFDTATFDSISLSWDEVTSSDLANYEIYRSDDNISFTKVAQTTENNYVDKGLSQNTLYYYKVRSVDLLGNQSAFTSYLMCITAADLRPPNTPTAVRFTQSKNIIHLVWLPSTSALLDRYEIEYTAVDQWHRSLGDTVVVSVMSPQTDYTIRNLSPNQLYEITIRSISINDIPSERVIGYEYAGDDIGPPDIITLVATDFESSVTQGTNGITLSWDTYEDGYESWSGTTQIIIEEFGNDYQIVANTITLDNGVTSYSFEIFAHIYNNELIEKSVFARTKYFFTVRNVDENGNASIGKRIHHYTPNYKKPRSPFDFNVIQQADKSLLFTYKNSTSIFTKNYISLYRITQSGTKIDILQNFNNGINESYTLTFTDVVPGNTYYFSVYCIDEYNNVSNTVSVNYTVDDIDFGIPPTQPSITVTSSNKNVSITWTQKEIEKIEYYKIYRSTNQGATAGEDFEIVTYIPAGQFSYIDYEVDYGFYYNYFMTAVDVYGQESPNIVTDSVASISIKTVVVNKFGKLNYPENLVATQVGLNIELTWENSGGIFDSFEIYRSLGNKYTFVYIDNVDAATTYYLDANALENSQAIYYLVRKVRNEAEIFLTESELPVTGGILLATLNTKKTPAILDNTVCRNISGFEASLSEEGIAKINGHKHGKNGVSFIELSDKIEITDWLSTDGQTFFTQTDISDGTSSEVLLNSIKANGYGLNYDINYSLGRLTFSNQLYKIESNDTAEYPFAVPPTIRVTVSGFAEVQGILPNSRLDNIDASLFQTGVFVKKQLPTTHHDGRIKEDLVPKQEILAALPGNYTYSYNVVDVTLTIGNCVTFFDIHPIYGLDRSLFASTSAGILISRDNGVTWEEGLYLNTPIVKFFYSSKYDIYLAATNTGVFYTRGVGTVEAGQENVNISLRLWQEIRGVENAKIVHDFAADADGEVYCVTELGAYKLRRPVFDSNYFFEQLTVLNANSTHAYSIMYDANLSRLIISNDYGIFETYDGGSIWFFSDEFTLQKPIYAFIQKDEYIYAITNFMIWRKSVNEAFFIRVGVIEDATMMRKIQIFKDRLYVTTDIGIYVSSVVSNIYTENTIVFEIAFPNLKTNGKDLPATSLNVIDDILYIGSENKLFISKDGKNIGLHYEGSGNVIPTIYVDQVKQTIGYRYYISQDILRKFVCFDERVDEQKLVTLANQYKVFMARNGGWYFDNPESSVALLVDGFTVNKMSIAERPESGLVALLNASDSAGAKILKSFRKYNDGGKPAGAVLQKLYNLSNDTAANDKYTNTVSDGKFNDELGDDKLVDPQYLGGDGLGGIKGGTVEVPGYGPVVPPAPPLISGFSGISGIPSPPSTGG